MKRKNDFGEYSQLNARTEGTYWDIAERVESKKCVFCELKDKYIIVEKKGWVLTVNIFPYINGHLMVIPKRHVENYVELTQKDHIVAHKLMKVGVLLLRQELGVDGIWLILRDGRIAQKTVSHLHWQIMPYIKGLNEWNFQKITVAPIVLAQRLRRAL